MAGCESWLTQLGNRPLRQEHPEAAAGLNSTPPLRASKHGFDLLRRGDELIRLSDRQLLARLGRRLVDERAHLTADT